MEALGPDVSLSGYVYLQLKTGSRALPGRGEGRNIRVNHCEVCLPQEKTSSCECPGDRGPNIVTRSSSTLRLVSRSMYVDKVKATDYRRRPYAGGSVWPGLEHVLFRICFFTST